MTAESAHTLRLFGSVARGDSDCLSDIDVLLVPDSPKLFLASHWPRVLRNRLGEFELSVYSRRRMVAMWSSGHLFAWHLFLESSPLWCESDWLGTLGAPAPNVEGLADARALVNVLDGVIGGLASCPASVGFEAGVLYVALRNIGINASSAIAGGPIFGRLAPFWLAERTRIAAPFDPATYSLWAKARAASTRAIDPPDLNVDELLSAASAARQWSLDVLRFVGNLEETCSA